MEIYSKDNEVSHETEGQRSSCISIIGNIRARDLNGVNARRMDSLHSSSLLLSVYVSVT